LVNAAKLWGGSGWGLPAPFYTFGMADGPADPMTTAFSFETGYAIWCLAEIAGSCSAGRCTPYPLPAHALASGTGHQLVPARPAPAQRPAHRLSRLGPRCPLSVPRAVRVAREHVSWICDGVYLSRGARRGSPPIGPRSRDYPTGSCRTASSRWLSRSRTNAA
jgi:hypothetical protein